ncbi:MAG: hypothetical protein DRJ66_01870 [Thermoprotei archaeon]|nr:MAG: hypothetical protein DRJ66_01870 [Thermoprotei archaeon]
MGCEIMIQKVILENFKRYRGRHEIVFKSGLNLIQGHNDAGKSSIFHAISFVLFNQTPTLKTATYPLITVGESYTRVTVEMVSSKTGLLYRITRYRPASRSSSSRFELKEYRPGEGWHTIISSTSGARERDLRIKLYEIFGLDKNVFFNVIYAEQKEFVRLIRGGAEVRRILDSLLGISAITSARSAIREMISNLRMRISDLENIAREAPNFRKLISETESRVKELSDRLISAEREYRSLLEEFEKLRETSKKFISIKNKINEVRELRRSILRLRAEKERLLKEYKRLLSPWGSVEQLSERISRLKERVNSINKQIDSLTKSLMDIEEQIANANQRLGYITNTLRLRKSVSGKTKCPTCGQPIDRERIRREIESLELESSRLSNLLSELSLRKNNINELILKLRSKREEIRSEMAKLETVLSSIIEYEKSIRELEGKSTELSEKITSVLNELTGKLSSLSIRVQNPPSIDNLDDFETTIEELYEEHMRNYYSVSEAIKGLKQRIREILTDRQGLMNYLQQLRQNLRTYEEAQVKIKTYRSVLQDLVKIEACYAELENTLRRRILNVIAKRTYYWYRQLTSDPLYLSVELDPETYELKALPHGFKEPQPIRSFSGGGHETIFALAFRLALADILGFHDFLLLDEPTDATDTANRDAMIEALYKATQRFHQILLITHHGVGSEVSAHILHVYYDRLAQTSKIEVIRD